MPINMGFTISYSNELKQQFLNAGLTPQEIEKMKLMHAGKCMKIAKLDAKDQYKKPTIRKMGYEVAEILFNNFGGLNFYFPMTNRRRGGRPAVPKVEPVKVKRTTLNEHGVPLAWQHKFSTKEDYEKYLRTLISQGVYR